MGRQVLVDLTALTDAITYLGQRPYKEVVDLIHNIKHTVKEVKVEKEESKEEKSDSVPSTPTDPTRPGSSEFRR